MVVVAGAVVVMFMAVVAEYVVVCENLSDKLKVQVPVNATASQRMPPTLSISETIIVSAAASAAIVAPVAVAGTVVVAVADSAALAHASTHTKSRDIAWHVAPLAPVVGAGIRPTQRRR